MIGFASIGSQSGVDLRTIGTDNVSENDDLCLGQTKGIPHLTRSGYVQLHHCVG